MKVREELKLYWALVCKSSAFHDSFPGMYLYCSPALLLPLLGGTSSLAASSPLARDWCPSWCEVRSWSSSLLLPWQICSLSSLNKMLEVSHDEQCGKALLSLGKVSKEGGQLKSNFSWAKLAGTVLLQKFVCVILNWSWNCSGLKNIFLLKLFVKNGKNNLNFFIDSTEL